MLEPALPLSRHRLIHTRSLDEALLHYSRLNAPVTVEPTERRAPFECLVNAVSLGPLSLSTHWYRYGFQARTEAMEDTFSLVIPLAGACELVHGRVKVPLGVDRSASMASPHSLVRARFEPGYRSIEAVIRRPALEAALAALTGTPVRTPLRFEPHIITSSGGGAALLRLVHFLVTEAERDEQMLGAPLVATHFADALLHHLLSTQPHNHRALLEAPARAAEPRYVQRAAEYLEAKADAPVSMAELSTVTGISVRSLQAGFRSFRGCSPMEFLRARRLELARQQLLAGAAATVAQVALACGFEHFGRFSAYYRVRFGESPVTTWRGARTRQPAHTG
jgi:AraC-like DNA-binding protein